jgi:hypothetical protein
LSFVSIASNPALNKAYKLLFALHGRFSRSNRTIKPYSELVSGKHTVNREAVLPVEPTQEVFLHHLFHFHLSSTHFVLFIAASNQLVDLFPILMLIIIRSNNERASSSTESCLRGDRSYNFFALGVLASIRAKMNSSSGRTEAFV